MIKKPTVRGEIRRARRVECAVPGTLHVRDVSIACVVEDMSVVGARIRLSGHMALTETFRFEFPKRSILVDAELIWQRGDEAGIRFLHRKQET